MASTITINLTARPTNGSVIVFNNIVNILERFQFTQRSTRRQVVIGNSIEQTINNLKNSFQVDYNSTNTYSLLLSGSGDNRTLRITVSSPNFFIANRFFTDIPSLVVSFTNVPDVPALDITKVEFKAPSQDPCSQLDADITTNRQVDSYTLEGGPEISVSSNPFTLVNLPRGRYRTLIVKQGSETDRYNVLAKLPVVSSQITTSYLNSPSGATLTVTRIGVLWESNGNKYSLDGVNYQESNVFNGLLADNYTVYVNDIYGCVATSSVTIPSFEDGGVGERFPYSDLPSKSNSIRFARYTNWGNCSDYKNDENTLSWQLPYTENSYEYTQLFQGCDIITTQIKTNYSNIVVTVVDENLSETNITTEAKTDYIDLKDSRDAIIYNISNLGVETGLYFLSGNTYNYSTGTTSGDYNLNGNLPAWGVIGNFVFVNGGWFKIVNIIFDEEVAAYVLVIDASYTSLSATVTVSSIYSLESYNIYEFSINMQQFLNKKIQVNISQTDTDLSFSEEVYLSEVIEVLETHQDTLLIEYYNENNTDMFYGTGIRNRVRIPIDLFQGGFSDDVKSEKTDINTYLVDSEGYENDLISFKLMPKQMMRKVIQALAHKFVFLNEVQYVKEESPEVVSLAGTNLYRVKAQMTKSNAVYTSRGSDKLFSVGSYEIPSLLRLESEGLQRVKK